MDRCAGLRVDFITHRDDRFPPLLRMIPDPPFALFVRGDLACLSDNPCVAVVGARKGTRFGLERAHGIARGLAKRGFTVVSGMAYGIDCAAHRGALSGKGATAAVWGTGPDVVYPRANRDLAERIAESGAILSEFPPGTGPECHHFPQRNRIISGLSAGVVIVEAAEKSGSLITAEFALEQGREVCAVPGSAGLVATRGSNALIKQGAVLVEDAEDVVQALSETKAAPAYRKKTGQVKSDVGTESRFDDPLLSMFVGDECISLDELIERSGGGAAEILEKVSRCVIDGLLEELPGGRYKLMRS
jgi:DNA processing protein